MKNTSLTLILLLLATAAWSQLSDDFSDGDFTSSPTWSGDTEKFAVIDQQLQLNDSDAGTAFIYTDVNFDLGNTTWLMDVVMDFAPSSNNSLDIYFAMDGADIASASGYAIHIGENGSEDALTLNEITEGNTIELGRGTMGATSEDPVQVRLKIDHIDQELLIYADYGNTGFFGLEPEIMVMDVTVPEEGIIGFFCKYSSSRKDAFYFDNISVSKYEVDTTPPSIVEAITLGEKTVRVIFDEALSESGLLDVNNYALNNNSVASVNFDSSSPNIIDFTLAQPLSAKDPTMLTIVSVRDLAGNEANNLSVSFSYSRAPVPGDLVINEILTDPIGNGSDFIEIYNRTDEFINLEGCFIINELSNRLETIGELTLLPNGYLALTEDVDNLISTYEPVAEAKIAFQDLPSLNNDEANVTISNAEGFTLDSFTYSEEWHLALLDDTEGVSLERISVEGETQSRENWQSASSTVNFATPGYKNSNALSIGTSESEFTLLSDSFSPNQDGIDDVIGIQYTLEKPGYISNIRIYDAEGYEIRRLHNNQTLGTSGVILWNGLDDRGALSNIGMYIAVGEVFHTDGETKRFKLAFALLDFID